MSFDPNLSAQNSLISSAELRSQFNGLFDLIQNIPAGPQGDAGPPGPPFASAVVDSVFVTTDGTANVASNFDGAIVHLTFWIPQGPQGPQGPPGEVSLIELDTAIAGTARNPDTVAPLVLTVSDPPTQAEVQQLVDKINELIAALFRPPA